MKLLLLNGNNLMEEYGEDQEKEFVKLLVSHQSLLQAFVVSLLPGSSETDDVVQNTNEVLWRKRAKFKLGTNFKAWALTTARLQAMSVQQRLKREKHTCLDEEVCEAVFQEAMVKDPSETKEKLNFLNECIRLLQIKDQELVLHRYWEKSGLCEYAKATGRSVEALRASLYRIRTRLRKCIKLKLQHAHSGKGMI